MVLEVYDDDGGSKADFIGKTETTLGAIMGAHLSHLTLDLHDHQGKTVGRVTIRGEKVQGSSCTI